MKYRDFLKSRLSDRLQSTTRIPSGYALVGHVALVNAESGDPNFLEVLGKATLEFDTRIESVAVRVGPTRGRERAPSYMLIAGNQKTETLHTEAGVHFRLDPLRITFSAGNRRERFRVREQVRPGEVVVDMFACVGQFALHAGSSREDVLVTAIEISKTAFDYLVENIALNRLQDRVFPVLGDCRTEHPLGTADRVYMGYLHGTVDYLPYALQTLKESGGFIHMHSAHPEEESKVVKEKIADICAAHGFRAGVVARMVKWYSPRVAHKVYDIQVWK